MIPTRPAEVAFHQTAHSTGLPKESPNRHQARRPKPQALPGSSCFRIERGTHQSCLQCTRPDGSSREHMLFEGVDDPAATSGVTSRPGAAVPERTPGRRTSAASRRSADSSNTGQGPAAATGVILALGVAAPKSTPGRQKDYHLQGGAHPCCVGAGGPVATTGVFPHPARLLWSRLQRRESLATPEGAHSGVSWSLPLRLRGTRRWGSGPRSSGQTVHTTSVPHPRSAWGLHLSCLRPGGLFQNHSWHSSLYGRLSREIRRRALEPQAALADGTRRACSQRDRLQGRHASELPRDG